jgi:hypothetical protein
MKKNNFYLYIFLVILMIAFVQYAKIYFIENIFFIIIESFVAEIIIISFLIVGYKILDFFKMESLNFIEKNVFSFGIGAGVYMLTMFFLGVLGLYEVKIIFLIIFIPIIVGFKDILLITRTFIDKLSKIFFYKLNYKIFLLSLVIIIFSGITFLSSFVPPSYYDSLVYHLALPSLYKNAGKIFFVPFNLYSHFPQNMEMIFLIGLFSGRDVVPNILSSSIYFFTILAMISFCNRFFNKKIALISTLFFVTAPSVMLLSTSSYVECGLAFYMFVSLYTFILFITQDSDKKLEKYKFIILSGFFAGISFGIKYTGIIASIIILFLLTIQVITNWRDKNYLNFATFRDNFE